MNRHYTATQEPVSLSHHDAAPHPEAEAEWWFVQGRFDLDGRSHDFMVTAVRHASKGDAQTPGWLLLSSLRSDGEDAQAVISVASDGMARIAGEESREVLVEAGMPDALARAYVEELTGCGPPAPIQISQAPVLERADRLDLTWEQLSLRQTDNGEIALTFRLPGRDAPCTLTLTPTTDWFWDPACGAGFSFGSMAYASCPGMTLTGEAGGKPVTGTAWFDHQWGGRGWLESNEGADGREVLGWAWIAISLDDGRFLLVGRGEDVLTGKVLETSALLHGGGAAPRWVADVRTKPVAYWQSPDTHARYPVAWRIEIPELGADLVFTPFAEAGEIPVYGYFTAVWEGAGRVEGSFDGRRLACRGHLELYGYAMPASFETAQNSWIERIDNHIEAFLPKVIDEDWLTQTIGPALWPYDVAAHGATLSAPTWELLSRSGKHWRSVFGVLILRALGVEVAPYEQAITVIPELVHAGSLMIDDIQDHSLLRRGQPAIHTIYGQATTINTANWLYFLPLRTLENHPALDVAQREEIYRIIVDLFIRAHAGQAQDLFASAWDHEKVALHAPGTHAEKALQTYVLKTAAPVKAIAGIVCVIARADSATRAAVETYGEMAGVAYQIMDDVRNIDADPALGKDPGEDIREGRLTYAILRALERLDGPDRARLHTILAAGPDDTDAARLAEAIDLIKRTGALGACRAEAREMVESAWRELSRHVPPSVSKTMVRLMFTRLFADREAGSSETH